MGILFINWTRFFVGYYLAIIAALVCLNIIFYSRQEYWLLLTISSVLFVSYTALLIAFFKFKKWFKEFLKEAGISIKKPKK